MEIIDLPELRLGNRVFRRTDPPGVLPDTDGWMHSGCAIATDGTVVVAHPLGRQLLFLQPDGTTRIVPVPVLEMHSILREHGPEGETYWLVDNGHRFVQDAPDYAHYREFGAVIRVDINGRIQQELRCPEVDEYAHRHWQPTSLCRDHEGALWVADGYGTSLLHKYVDGQHVLTVDGSETGTAFDCPHGVAARGNKVLVADRSNRRIVVLDDGRPVSVLEAPLTSPSSLLVLGDWLLVTELFGGLAVFHGDEYIGHFARSRDDAERDAWPNDRQADGTIGRPALGNELHSPHGIASDGERIVVTEWLIGERVNQFQANRRE